MFRGAGSGAAPDQSAVLTDAEPPDDPGAGDGGPDHRDGAGELALDRTALHARRGQST
jgi:hypothetical protein